MFQKFKIFYDEGSAGATNSNDGDSNQDDGKANSDEVETIEKWLDGLDEALKTKGTALLTSRLERLQKTVKATREERDAFHNQLKEAIKKAGKDSDLGKQLETLSTSLDEANQKADFYEEAGVNNCHNPRAAFIIAKSENLFTKSGAVDWRRLQEMVPEFFGEKKQQTNFKRKTAGGGTSKTPSNSFNMNDWIRQQAGKQ